MQKVERMSAAEYNRKYGSFYKVKKNKFNAKKAYLDGKTFDSKSEGDLYAEYKLQERQGLIELVETQAKESFYAYGKHICDYWVDFKITHNDGMIEFAEHKSKGTVQPQWRIKWKMLLAKYDKEIKRGEVKCSINWYRGYQIKRYKPYG